MVGKKWTSVRIDSSDHWWLRYLAAKSGMKLSEYLHNLICDAADRDVTGQVAKDTVTSIGERDGGFKSPLGGNVG